MNFTIFCFLKALSVDAEGFGVCFEMGKKCALYIFDLSALYVHNTISMCILRSLSYSLST